MKPKKKSCWKRRTVERGEKKEAHWQIIRIGRQEHSVTDYESKGIVPVYHERISYSVLNEKRYQMHFKNKCISRANLSGGKWRDERCESVQP